MVRRQLSHTIWQSIVIPNGAFGKRENPNTVSCVEAVQSSRETKIGFSQSISEAEFGFFDQKFLGLQKGLNMEENGGLTLYRRLAAYTSTDSVGWQNWGEIK